MMKINYQYLFIFLIIGLLIYIISQQIALSDSVNELKGERLVEQFERIKGGVVFIISEIPSPREAAGMNYYVLSNGNYAKTGSGFIVDSDGLIVTARHVVSESSKVRVILITEFWEKDKITYQWEEFPIIKTADQTDLDIAFLKIDTPRKLDSLELADSSDLKIGERIGLIGFPYANPNKKENIYLLLSGGIISGIGVSKFSGTDIPVLFLNAFVNPGNSGGPVFLESNGKVVGVVNQRINDELGAQTGIGVSSRADILKKELEKIRQSGF